MNRNQGSITVYLCLTLTILLSLFAAMLKSVRLAGGRVIIASAMDQGLFSLFAQYDKELLEEYDLFYIDGGHGSGTLQMERLYDTLCQDAVYSLNPYGHGDRNFFGADYKSGSITGYILATDQTGNSFGRQVSEYMKQSLGISGIQQLSNILTEQTTRIESQDYQKSQIAAGDPLAVYEQEKQSAENAILESGEELPPATGTPPIKNPIEVINNIRKMGILGLVVSNSSELSDYSVDSSTMASGRNLNQGMGLLPIDNSNGIDKLLLSEYSIEKFSNYTNIKQAEGLSYQVEYMIGGKNSDRDNLKSVVNRLIAIRESANLIHLYTSPSKKAQADTMAATLAAAMLIPISLTIISAALLVCWAFAESILDIRELLNGGKIPLLKDEGSWQLSLENLPSLLENLDNNRKSDGQGFDYSWYLRFLLFTKSQTHLAKSAMDLVEYNINLKYPNKLFRIDNCVESLEAECLWKLDNNSYTICRSYSYAGT